MNLNDGMQNCVQIKGFIGAGGVSDPKKEEFSEVLFRA